MRKNIMAHLGLSKFDNVPVTLTEGDTPPMLRGESWHYETRGGSVIRHPSAYSRVGWSNMVYKGSTRQVFVGQDWKPEGKMEYKGSSRQVFADYSLVGQNWKPERV